MSPGHEPGPDLERQRELLVSLGGTYREVVGDDIAAALTAFGRAEQATQLIIGSRPGATRSRSRTSVVDALVEGVGGFDVHVVATGATVTPVWTALSPGHAPSRPRRNAVFAWIICLLVIPLLTMVFVRFRAHVSVGSALLIDLGPVMAVAALGGLRPGLVASAGAFGLTNWYMTPPLHTLSVGGTQNVMALSVFSR